MSNCLLCGHGKSQHGLIVCTAKDVEEGVEYDCICDCYESKSTSSSVYCDSCLDIAYEEVGPGHGEQVDFLDLMADLLSDHECDFVLEPEFVERCDCLTHKRNRNVTA